MAYAAKRTKGYRSKFEAEVAANLEKRGVSFEYERSKFAYHVPGLYTSDFTLPYGVIVECKGYFSPMDRKKLLRVREEHPEMDIRLLFMRPEVKLNPKSGSQGSNYGQWATRHGFMWAKGPEIPAEWILDGTGG